MGRIYISGPISGREREEYMRQFREAEDYLRSEGFQTVNPTRLLPCRWPWVYRLLGYRLTLLYDLFFLMRCQGIYMLDGWKQSRGARIEHCVADTLGMVVIDE
jgi:hypothetical protein